MAAYGTSIVDGTVTWQLISPTSLDGIRYDTGVAQVFEWGCDHSGPMRYGVNVLNSLAGTAPSQINISDTAFGSIEANFRVVAGSAMFVQNSQLDGCTHAGCSLVELDAGNSFSFHHNYLNGGVNGYNLATGAQINFTETGSIVTGWSTHGVAVNASTTNYVINDTIFGTAGTCAAAISDSGSSPKIVQATCP